MVSRSCFVSRTNCWDGLHHRRQEEEEEERLCVVLLAKHPKQHVTQRMSWCGVRRWGAAEVQHPTLEATPSHQSKTQRQAATPRCLHQHHRVQCYRRGLLQVARIRGPCGVRTLQTLKGRECQMAELKAPRWQRTAGVPHHWSLQVSAAGAMQRDLVPQRAAKETKQAVALHAAECPWQLVVTHQRLPCPQLQWRKLQQWLVQPFLSQRQMRRRQQRGHLAKGQRIPPSLRLSPPKLGLLSNRRALHLARGPPTPR
mmetsp:Transcript_23109/g.57464  ORF Transcript_23109/g.57464 Transcript_23109/m.57464 type:complete len:256 (+) Transcript_23109:1370-2137(+)